MSTTPHYPASTSASKSRRKHTKEFKQQAVALALWPEIGFRRAAEDLGINESLRRDWAKKSMIERSDVFRGHGVRTEVDARLAALERENRILREGAKGDAGGCYCRQ